MKSIRINDKEIGNNRPTYVIAEIGANFNNRIDRAKLLIDMAKLAGADCAKFQTFQADEIISKEGFEIIRENLTCVHSTWDKSVYEKFKDAELPFEWHIELKKYCKSVGIDFSTAPYGTKALKLCEQLDLPFIKVGSGEINNHEFLKAVCKLNKPVFLSTGASDMTEVRKAFDIITEHGNDIVLMQCTTNYPSSVESANINVIKTYKEIFGCLTGYSDHTMGIASSLAAVSIGANVIEKHFTLDSSDYGVDHPHSMMPGEFKVMVDHMRQIEKSFGSSYKRLTEEEREMVIVQRRGIYAAKDIGIDSPIMPDDIVLKRPAIYMDAKHYYSVLGMKSKIDVKKGEPLMSQNLQS